MNNTTKKLPLSLLHAEGADARTIIITIIHASLIPLIISANLLLIFGLMKTRRNNFTPSQILFLTLFLSDLTFGLVQLPFQIYLNLNFYEAAYFEIIAGSFSLVLPICLSGTILSVISIDRYIFVVHNKHYKRIVTNKSLSVTIALAILVSVIWATLTLTVKIERLYIAMSAYIGAIIAIGVVFNVTLLKNVKQKTKNSSIQQALDSSLTKTVSLILATLVAAYMPLMIAITLSISIVFHFPFTLLPSQVNAVLNSVIYFARSSRIKRYYYKLFNARIKRKDLTMPSVGGFNSNRRCQLTAAAEFYIKSKEENSNFYR